ncbi:MAG TPA: PKD domain-containing protein, partial [Bacteroidales bacterium]
ASLKMWEVTVDWDDVENSSVDYIGALPVDYYTSNGISISQPGTGQKLASLSDRLMYRLQYRNFGEYEVMLTNHTVKADDAGRAGIRWYEMRNYGEGWSLYQQGTYAPFDGNSRWMASIAMNDHGDIALGYSVSGSSTYPEIRCAMQSAEALEGLGVLDVDEIVLKPGLKSQTGVDRWGDYSSIAVDPTDGMTFWYTTEYSNGSWSWRTQISSFFYVQPLVADFSTEETLIPVGESLDFTDNTSGTPETWEWSFEGGTPATSTDQNPSGIVYDTEGVYNVTLTVTNEYGEDVMEKSEYITVSTTVLPEVAFEVNKQIVCNTDTVIFTDESMHKPIEWNWQFDPGTVTFVNGTDATSENPQVVFNTNETYALTLEVWNLNGSTELTYDTVAIVGGIRPLYIETFADTAFVSKYWTVENPDNDNGWQQYIVSGNDFDNNAVGIDFQDFEAIGNRDRIISPPFNLEGYSTAVLEFQHAYAKRLNKETDSLIIYVSDDCGQSWTRIFNEGDDGSGNFATHTLTSDFWPVEESDWCLSGYGAACFTLDISQWAGMANVKIAFEGYNNNGNPMFIDNVAVSQFVGQDELISNKEELLVYPNPNSGLFSVQLPKDHKFEKLQILNYLSQVVYKSSLNENSTNMEIQLGNDLVPGIYILQFGGNGKTLTKKIVIN